MEAVIDVQNLTRRFGKLTAVSGVNFKVFGGEIFGFLGPNGAGKTTTVRMLTGVIEPSEGTARIEDHDICKEPLLSRAHLAVVPEEANVYVDLSVWQNVILMGQLYGIEKNCLIEEANQFLDKLDLRERKKQKARQLSKGLRQRLMLACALVTRPDILFLDEPTSGLDVKSTKIIQQIITDLNKKGITVFLTTHNMAEASQMCSRVAIINKGKIAAVDSPERLKSAISSRQYVEVRFEAKNLDNSVFNSLEGISQIETENRTYKLFTNTPPKVATELVCSAKEKGLKITHISTCMPTLDEVFLYFTQEHQKEG